jgi:hypothetical protein
MSTAGVLQRAARRACGEQQRQAAGNDAQAAAAASIRP